MTEPLTRREHLLAVVQRVHDENLERYSTPEAEANIKAAIQRSFPRPWIYLNELIQNAIDAGATAVRIAGKDDELVFEHDAPQLFDEAAIAAISKLGMSTKHRLESVGFMGVGFKSVFQRVRRVEISDADLRMFFEVESRAGVFGVPIRTWQDLVLPKWCDTIPPPSDGFTTRFVLRGRLDERSYADDLAEVFPVGGPPDSLVFLALKGLRRLTAHETTFDLKAGRSVVHAQSSAGARSWFVARVTYQPSREAFGALAYHRQPDLDPKEESGLATPREVVAAVPLDENGLPDPPGSGHVYATLPTGDDLHLRLLLQADWLLDISRQGLIDVRSNAWQSEIIQQVPILLEKLLHALAIAGGRGQLEVVRRGVRILDSLADASSDFDGALDHPDFLHDLATRLRPIAFVPIYPESGRLTASPGEVVVPPDPILAALRFAGGLQPATAFGAFVPTPALLQELSTLRCTLERLGLLRDLTVDDLAKLWPDSLEAWWQALNHLDADQPPAKRRRTRAAVEILAAVELLREEDPAYRSLCVAPTEAGAFVAPGRILGFKEPMPADDTLFGTLLRDRAPETWPTPEQLLHSDVQAGLEPGSTIAQDARDIVSRADRLLTNRRSLDPEVRIRDAMQRCWEGNALSTDLVLELGAWARERQKPRAVEFLIARAPGGDVVAAAAECVAAEPYVTRGVAVAAVFPDARIVSPIYERERPATHGDSWDRFLAKVPGIVGGGALTEHQQCFGQSDPRIRAILGVDPEPANKDGYTFIDYDFPSEARIDHAAHHLADWLEMHVRELRTRAKPHALSQYYGPKITRGMNPCSWVRRLTDLAWVPTRNHGLLPPPHVPIDIDGDDNLPLATISTHLLLALHGAGVPFGRDVALPGPLRRLEARGSSLSAAELSELIQHACAEEGDEASGEHLRTVVRNLEVPTMAGDRVRAGLLVWRPKSGKRPSTLGDAIVAAHEVDPILLDAIQQIPGFVIPDSVTGLQALTRLRDFWRQHSSADGVADGRSGWPAAAYGYLVEDADIDTELMEGFAALRGEVRVRVDRDWRPLGPDLVLDDLLDPDLQSIVEESGTQHMVRPGQFGDRAQARRVAAFLGIPCLSETLRPKVEPGAEQAPPWRSRLLQLCHVLGQLPDREPMEIRVYAWLRLIVGERTIEKAACIVDGTLLVTTEPAAFAEEAAGHLISQFRLEQRGDACPSLSIALMQLADENGFHAALERLAARLDLDVPAPEALAAVAPGGCGSPTAASQPTLHDSGEHRPPEQPRVDGQPQRPPSPWPQRSTPSEAHVSTPASPTPRPTSIQDPLSSRPGSNDGFRHGSAPSSPTGSADSGRSRSTPDAGRDIEGPDLRRAFARVSPGADGRTSSDHRPDDSHARDRVIAFEREHHREPNALDFNNVGFDIESFDPQRNVRRRIEVKGLPGCFTGEASVYLSRAQFEQALQASRSDVEYWLYVVDARQVHPIPWTRIGVRRFFFYGEDWAELAELEPGGAPERSTHHDLDLFEPAWVRLVQELRQSGVVVDCGRDLVDAQGRLLCASALEASLGDRTLSIVDGTTLPPDRHPLIEPLGTIAVLDPGTATEHVLAMLGAR